MSLDGYSVPSTMPTGRFTLPSPWAYYPRFGYRPASLWKIRCEWEVPDEVFMALELKAGGLSEVSGLVKYPAAFSERAAGEA